MHPHPSPLRPAARLLLLLLLLSACQLPATQAHFIDNISYNALLENLAKRPVLLFLTVDWCHHCRHLVPDIRALANAVADNPHVLVARADADRHPAISQTFAVTAFPSILFFPPNFSLHHPSHSPAEFSDWRWAEVIAEFVNNQTAQQTIAIHPRPAFQAWRRKHPYNLGSRPVSRPQLHRPQHNPQPPSHSPAAHPAIREPIALTAHNFDSAVYAHPPSRTIVLFYQHHDPFLSHIIRQWRQASSAFTPADNLTVALADVTHHPSLLTRFHLQNTPSCLYFPSCQSEQPPQCNNNPIPCHDDLDDTDNLIQFISDRLMLELGIVPQQHPQPRTYSLTEQEYQAMKEQGVIFANDQQHQQQVHQMYQHQLAPKEEL